MSGSASIVTWLPNELTRIDSHSRRYSGSRSRSSAGRAVAGIHARHHGTSRCFISSLDFFTAGAGGTLLGRWARAAEAVT